jgi:hypothetical protein
MVFAYVVRKRREARESAVGEGRGCLTDGREHDWRMIVDG